MGNLPLNIFTFPLWWYTTGTWEVWQWVRRQYLYSLHQTGILLFSKHMGEPLYGDYTKSGIVFSFFLRIFILIYKLFVFAARMAVVLSLFLFYLALLPAALIMIIYQFFPK